MTRSVDRHRALQSRLLVAIRAKSWRGEASLCREFDQSWTGDSALARSPAVEDALFALVQAGKVEWFGGGQSGDEPLKYRTTGKAVARV